MNRITAVVVALLAFLSASAVVAEECTSNGLSDPFECRELIIEYDPTFDVTAFHSRFGSATIYDLTHLHLLLVRAPDVATRELIESIGFAGIRSIEVNSRLLNPECQQITMGVIEIGAELNDLAAQPALQAIGATGRRADGVLVAVADSGFDSLHPAFARITFTAGVDLVDGDQNPTEVADGVDQDGDGFIDPGFGHGTAVASLIATIAPGVALLPIRITDDECRTTAMRVATAIYIAAEAHAHVFNLSMTMNNAHGAIQHAIDYADDAGTLVIVPSGNTGTNPAQYPALGSRTFAVAATDALGIKAEFSSYDSAIDISAPGAAVLTAYPDGAFASYEGSSFAAAVVSGVAALGYAAQPCLDVDAMFRRLADSARPIDQLDGNQQYRGKLGAGLVDARALLAASSPTEAVALLATRLGEHVALHWQANASVPETMLIAALDKRCDLTHIDTPGCRACTVAPIEVCRAPGDQLFCVTPEPLVVASRAVRYLHPLSQCRTSFGP